MRLLVVATALAVAGCSSPARLDYGPDEASRWIPITWQRGVMMIEGSLDQKPVTYLVDCGATHVFVDRDAVADQSPAGDNLDISAVGSSITAVSLGPVTLGLGGWSIQESEVAAVDLGPAANALGAPFAAVAGLPLFARFVIDCDFDNDRLRLIEPDAFAGSASADTATALPLRRGRLGLHIQCAIEGGSPVWLQLDSGSNGGLTLTRAYVDERELLADRKSSTLWIGGAGGDTTTPATTLEKVALADLVLTAAPMTAPDTVADEGTVGRIGMAILRRFRLIFDLSRDRLFLVPRNDWDRPFDRDRAGLAVRLDDGQLEVLHVSPGSPARATALSPGDRIVAIDGNKITADYWRDQSRWCNAPAGQKVTLELSSGLSVQLELADFY